MTGHSKAHESPASLSLTVLWFRYHNHLAAQVQAKHPHLADEKIFHIVRRRVIATLQVHLILLIYLILY